MRTCLVLASLALLALAVAACTDEEPTPPAPTCEGVPLTCSGFATREGCFDQLGCSADGDECSGVARSCDLISSRTYCDDQQGCYWSATSNRCTGSAWSCNLYRGDQLACLRQTGCSWEPLRCTGVPLSCDGFFDGASCGEQLGCRWE